MIITTTKIKKCAERQLAGLLREREIAVNTGGLNNPDILIVENGIREVVKLVHTLTGERPKNLIDI